MADSSLEAVTAHIEQHVGKVSMVWHEILSDLVHIDVHQVAPTEDRPFWTLVTSGMSDLPMTVPSGREEWAFAELMLCLPKEWKMGQTDFKDERFYWPIRWLKILARFPHEYKTWLCWGHTMPNGDPPKPIHESAPFSGWMLRLPQTASREFWELPVRPGKLIRFFSAVPLFSGEMDLKLKKGAEEIERLFERHKVSEVIDLNRKDTSKREWWRLL